MPPRTLGEEGVCGGLPEEQGKKCHRVCSSHAMKPLVFIGGTVNFLPWALAIPAKRTDQDNGIDVGAPLCAPGTELRTFPVSLFIPRYNPVRYISLVPLYRWKD